MAASDDRLLAMGATLVKLKSQIRYPLRLWIATPGCDCISCQVRRGGS